MKSPSRRVMSLRVRGFFLLLVIALLVRCGELPTEPLRPTPAPEAPTTTSTPIPQTPTPAPTTTRGILTPPITRTPILQTSTPTPTRTPFPHPTRPPFDLGGDWSGSFREGGTFRSINARVAHAGEDVTIRFAGRFVDWKFVGKLRGGGRRLLTGQLLLDDPLDPQSVAGLQGEASHSSISLESGGYAILLTR